MNEIKIIFNSYIFIFIFIFLYFIIDDISCSIVIPVDTLSEDNYIFENNDTHSSIIYKHYYKDLYTLFEIGTPIQKIFLFIRTKYQDYEILSSTIFENNEKINVKYNLSNFYKSYNLFNEKLSSTYENKGCHESLGVLDDEEKICNSKDIFLFYDDKNITEKKIYKNLLFKY